MRVITCSAVALFFVIVSVCTAAPVMHVDNSKFDFGEVFQGEKVPHVFKFTNTGDEILKIDRVRSSCGCTAVLVSEKEIPPGGMGEIKANFDSARFRGDVTKTIYVYNNDPVRPTRQLHIKGKILQKIAIEPSQVNFGTVGVDEEVSATLVLRNRIDQPMAIGKTKSTAQELAVKMSPTTLKQNEELTIELTLTAKPGRSRFSGYVLVPVDGVPGNELRIPVYATIKKLE